MAAITGFPAEDENGFPILADAHGNNVAFRCVGCGGPILAIARPHQRGSSDENPSVCPACSARYWVEPMSDKLVIHRVSGKRVGAA